MIEQALVFVENLGWVTALRNSTYLYPLVNAGHILGLAMLIGGIVPLDLRLLGLWRSYPLMVFVDVLRITSAVGLGVAAICGVLLFATAAADYARSPLFQVKILLVLVGVLNALVLGRLMQRRDIQNLPLDAGLPVSVRIGATVSLAVWLTVLILGRLLGYF